MKNIKADADRSFQESLISLKAGTSAEREFHNMMKQMSHINAGRKFSREDMNSNTAESSPISR